LLQLEQPANGLGGGVGVAQPENCQIRPRWNITVEQGVGVAGLARTGCLDAGQVAQEGDAAVPMADQMLDGDACAGSVIHADAVGPQANRWSIDHHN